MKNLNRTKSLSECVTEDDFIEYYRGASKGELRNRLADLGETKKLPILKDRERDAIKAWLS